MGNSTDYTNTIMDIKAILWVFLGGGLGSSLRYLFSILFKSTNTYFPFATITANIIGCLLLGLFLGYLNKLELMREELTLFLMIGFCGGLTTFSSFTLDLFNLSKASSMVYPFIYFTATICLGTFSLLFGLWLSR